MDRDHVGTHRINSWKTSEIDRKVLTVEPNLDNYPLWIIWRLKHTQVKSLVDMTLVETVILYIISKKQVCGSYGLVLESLLSWLWREKLFDRFTILRTYGLKLLVLLSPINSELLIGKQFEMKKGSTIMNSKRIEISQELNLPDGQPSSNHINSFLRKTVGEWSSWCPNFLWSMGMTKMVFCVVKGWLVSETTPDV